MDCVLLDIKHVNLGIGWSSQGIKGCGVGPLWRRRPALGCSAEEEREGEEEDTCASPKIFFLFSGLE